MTGVPVMISLFLNKNIASVLDAGGQQSYPPDETEIESYLENLRGPNGEPLYEGASTTMVQLQETCLLCHSAWGYNGVTSSSGYDAYGWSIGPIFNDIAPIGGSNAVYMNNEYFNTKLTLTQINNIVNLINNTFAAGTSTISPNLCNIWLASYDAGDVSELNSSGATIGTSAYYYPNALAIELSGNNGEYFPYKGPEWP